jgi:hypothetical protein
VENAAKTAEFRKPGASEMPLLACGAHRKTGIVKERPAQAATILTILCVKLCENPLRGDFGADRSTHADVHGTKPVYV